MQHASETPSSAMSRLPYEILSMILRFAMKSDMPVHLEHFLKLGRQFQKTNVNGTEISRPRAPPACSESWFLNHLHPSQIEPFRDWILINSTCRRFRAWGKDAFFLEKTFVIPPMFLETLIGETAKGISAENKATARASIRHVVASSPHCGIMSQLMALPRYHILERLRSLSIPLGCPESHMLLSLNSPTLESYPLPEELSSLLRDLGLQVDQLRTNLLCGHHEGLPMSFLITTVYPHLRAMSAWRKKHRDFEGSDDGE